MKYMLTMDAMRINNRKFLLWLSGLQTRLVSMRMQVRFLASLGGLTTQRCYKLWHRPAAAAPIPPLNWELPYAAGASLKRKKKNQ